MHLGLLEILKTCTLSKDSGFVTIKAGNLQTKN
jgi:hypothetical protein